MEEAVIKKTRQFVEKQFAKESTGHDWWHLYRVWQLAKHIAEKEPAADKFIVELGALLHDIADWKFNGGDLEAGPKAARKWLSSQKVGEEVITKVEDIIRNVSFKGANVKQQMNLLEGKIVSDADKLDAMGAIGIARAFAYGGANNHLIYDPTVKPTLHKTFKSYQNDQSHSVNHFYEKILLLPERLYTKTAKDMAKHRHHYLEEYLKEFYKEWEGEV